MKVLFEQNNYPVLQNRVYDSYKQAISCPRGDISLVQDLKTGLIFNEAFKPEFVKYDINYNNEQSTSLVFQNHLKEVKKIIKINLGTNNLVEVGCGKGFFLEMLQADKFDITGFDPTYEGNNPNIIKELFSSNSFKSSKGIILRHVLEHIPNPFDFLCQLRRANGGGGLIYIEVPCFDWICKKKTWYDIFYEHVNYFRMQDFIKMFSRVILKKYLFGGQYLGIVADLSTLKTSLKNGLDRVSFPCDFLKSLHDQRLNKDPVCIWGAASKGVIFSLLRQRANLPVEYAIDINPAKQGKFLPITGLKVLSPKLALKELRKKTIIYIMNSNYYNEIKKLSLNQFKYKILDDE
jgi:hypothetical protein